MKILLFGGAFDPPHLGHISILQSALLWGDFDKAIIMPTGTPTHKNSCVAPFEVRKLLAQKAFCPLLPIVEVSDFEGTNLEADYTFITLEHLKSIYLDAEIYMLIGQDSLLSLESWVEYKKVIANCKILSFARQENEKQQIIDKIQTLTEMGGKAKLIESDIRPFSSTEIRLLEKKNGDISSLVSKETKAVIDEYDLYDSDEYKRHYGTARLLVSLLLDTKRQLHTFNVEKLAEKLAQKYDVDVKKIKLAALLHDIMKNAPHDILLHRAKQSDIITKINAKALPTLHGYAAADYAKKELKIQDEEIIAALKSHTCGRSGMQDFEKVLYLADMLCEERDFKDKEKLLEYAFESLDFAMEKSLEQTISWLKQAGKILDEDSVDALEYFKEKNK